ncbi:MAG: protein-L-isoaspartate O-methyltransferase family protein [Pikeienuella sp.]
MTDFAKSRVAMVDRQVRPSDVTSFPIIDAMLGVPRERYTPVALRAVAYADAPLTLAPGREMLDPRVFAKMLDGANIGPDDLVLDLAPGLGYSTAVIARMAAAVIAIEPDPALAAAGAEILIAQEVDNALLSEGAAAAGDPAHGPYDAIFINGAVGAPPMSLHGQVKEGGRIVAIEMNGANGRAMAYIRDGAGFQPRALFNATGLILPGFEKVEEFAL